MSIRTETTDQIRLTREVGFYRCSELGVDCTARPGEFCAHVSGDDAYESDVARVWVFNGRAIVDVDCHGLTSDQLSNLGKAITAAQEALVFTDED